VIEDVRMSSALAPAQLIVHDTGVSASPSRRRFTAAYKRSILRDAARCSQPGDLAALLRREGLYSSHLAAWRAAERRGDLAGPTKRRGPTATPVDPQAKRVAELERQLAKTTARAERAEGLVALQKKVAELFGQTLDTPSEPR
jgi:transposase